MTRQSLPIGIQDFATIRSEGFYYVDKTPLIRQLVSAGRHYFLSRPRRFGKSLLVDTLSALFAGQEDLFRGLDIHDHWDWSVTHPVVRLSFDGKYDTPAEIDGDVIEQLEAVEDEYGLTPAQASNTGPRRLRNILRRVHQKTGQQVVVLVDEYDKPILDGLPDLDQAHANRDYLQGFYGIIKGSAAHVRFVFVTGVSMFSKVSLFSGLNNLKDISLDPRFATICGYTDADIDTVFAPELDGLDRDEIRSWYNGYNWRGTARLYNPFDVLLLFNDREFEPYWFETGSPTFLFETLKATSANRVFLSDTGRLCPAFWLEIPLLGPKNAPMTLKVIFCTHLESTRIGITKIAVVRDSIMPDFDTKCPPIPALHLTPEILVVPNVDREARIVTMTVG